MSDYAEYYVGYDDYWKYYRGDNSLTYYTNGTLILGQQGIYGKEQFKLTFSEDVALESLLPGFFYDTTTSRPDYGYTSAAFTKGIVFDKNTGTLTFDATKYFVDATKTDKIDKITRIHLNNDITTMTFNYTDTPQPLNIDGNVTVKNLTTTGDVTNNITLNGVYVSEIKTEGSNNTLTINTKGFNGKVNLGSLVNLNRKIIINAEPSTVVLDVIENPSNTTIEVTNGFYKNFTADSMSVDNESYTVLKIDSTDIKENLIGTIEIKIKDNPLIDISAIKFTYRDSSWNLHDSTVGETFGLSSDNWVLLEERPNYYVYGNDLIVIHKFFDDGGTEYLDALNALPEPESGTAFNLPTGFDFYTGDSVSFAEGYSVFLADYIEPDDQATWKTNKTDGKFDGSVTYGTTAGQSGFSSFVESGVTTCTYKEADSGYSVTIRGFDTSKESEVIAALNEITVNGDSSGGIISLSQELLELMADVNEGYKTLTLEGEGWTFENLGEYIETYISSDSANAPYFKHKGTTATLKIGASAGYVLAEDSKSVSYNTDDSGINIFKISGVSATAGHIQKEVYDSSNRSISIPSDFFDSDTPLVIETADGYSGDKYNLNLSDLTDENYNIQIKSDKVGNINAAYFQGTIEFVESKTLSSGYVTTGGNGITNFILKITNDGEIGEDNEGKFTLYVDNLNGMTIDFAKISGIPILSDDNKTLTIADVEIHSNIAIDPGSIMVKNDGNIWFGLYENLPIWSRNGNNYTCSINGNTIITVSGLPETDDISPTPTDSNIISLDLPDKVTVTFEGGLLSGLAYVSGKVSYDTENRVITLAKDAVFKADNLSLGTDIKTNFEITALNDSAIDIEGSTIAPVIVIKDGSAVHLSGTIFGLEGDISLEGGDLSFALNSLINPEGVNDLTLSSGATFTISVENSKDIKITAPEDATAQISFRDGKISVTSTDEKGVIISTDDRNLGNLNIIGTIVIDTSNKAVEIAKDTVINFVTDERTTFKAVATDDTTLLTLLVENNDTKVIYLHNTEKNISFDMAMSNDDKTVFEGNFDFLGGLSYGFATNTLGVVQGSTAKFSFGGYEITLKATEETGTFTNYLNFDSGKVTLKPFEHNSILYNTVNCSIAKDGETTLSTQISIGKDSEITIDNAEQSISIAAGSTVDLTFSKDYSIRLTANDTAGGKFALVEGGIQFTPNEGDGKLEVTVTNGDTVRTATLELTGAVTFALGGTISLAKDSVMDITFEDGENLKIISNEDASGKIKFGGTEGVTITPANPTALTVAVTSPNYADIRLSYTDMTGSITYSGGNIILSDETSLIYRVYYGDSVLSERTASTSGGTSTLGMSATDRSYTPSEGAILTDMDNNSGHGVVISKGNLSQYMSGVRYISKITEGTIVNANSDTNFILEKAGEYTLNGSKVTTTEDNVEVKLIDWNTIEFDASAKLTVDGEEYTGDEGTTVRIIKDVENENVSLVMYKKGNVHVNGEGHSVNLELLKDDENGTIITSDDDGFTVSHLMTAEEVESYGDPKSFIGKYFDEKVTISDKTYSIELYTEGIDKIKNVSGGATITALATVKDENYENGTWFYVVTETEGKFTFGKNAVNVSGDDSVVFAVSFDKDGEGYVFEVNDLDGSFEGKVCEEITINGEKVTMSEGSDKFSVLADDKNIIVSGVKDGAEVTFDSDKVEVVMDGKELTVNGVTYKVSGDKDGVTIDKDGVTGLDKNAKLSISPAGTYNVNGANLTVEEWNTIIGTEDSAEIMQEMNSKSTTEELLDELGISEEKAEEVTGNNTTTDLTDSNKKAAVVDKDAEGNVNVKMNDKGNAAIVEDTDANVKVTGGAGNDSLVSKGEDVTFDMKKGGNDKVTALAGNVTLENYNPESGSGIQLTSEQLSKKGFEFDSGKVKLGEGEDAPEVVFGDVTQNFVNMYTPENEKVEVGFASKYNPNVDASDKKEDMILIGGDEYNGMSLAEEVENASLKGGAGNDTITAGKGAYVDAGAGKNFVQMSDKGGATLNFAEGKTTVDNFNFVGNDEKVDADKIQSGDVVIDSVEVDENGNAIFKTAKGDITVNDAAGKTIAFRNDYTDDVINMTIADDELNIVENGHYLAAGENAKVDLKDYKGEKANVNLNNGNFNEKDGLSFYGDVKDVSAKGYDKEAVITANDKANSIVASDGGSTIYGGAGKDTFVGGAGADEFVVGTGDKLISEFTTGTDDNADKVNTEKAVVNTVEVKDNNAILNTDDGKVSIEGAAGQIMKFQNAYTDGTINMQVSDKEVAVTEDAYYIASGKDAKVDLSGYTGKELAANLADGNFNKKDGLSFYGDIKELDASGFKGDAKLAGNNGDNVIKAGSGTSSLWGGEGGNDTLIGGDGEDTFYYGKGNGKDVIEGAGKTDKINLRGFSLDDFTKYSDDLFVGNDVQFTTKDGGSLTVKDGKTSGSTYVVNDESFVVDGDHWKKVE